MAIHRCFSLLSNRFLSFAIFDKVIKVEMNVVDKVMIKDKIASWDREAHGTLFL